MRSSNFSSFSQNYGKRSSGVALTAFNVNTTLAVSTTWQFRMVLLWYVFLSTYLKIISKVRL